MQQIMIKVIDFAILFYLFKLSMGNVYKWIKDIFTQKQHW